jgi:thymidylate synthase (FAD)
MSYNTEVKLLSITPNAEELVEYAGRLCYKSENKLGTNKDWLKTRINQGHESLIEHASATFYIKCSRVVTHELVRHRIASYSQRSQRYVKELKSNYVIPPEVYEAECSDKYVEFMEEAWSKYKFLLDQGLKPEIARYALPNACYSEIICTWNFRELRNIIKQRDSKEALPEMQEVIHKVNLIMKEKAPNIF